MDADRMRRKLSQDEADDLTRDYKGGATVRDLCTMYDCTRETVNDIVTAAGIRRTRSEVAALGNRTLVVKSDERYFARLKAEEESDRSAETSELPTVDQVRHQDTR
jgi:hypothetical protein